MSHKPADAGFLRRWPSQAAGAFLLGCVLGTIALSGCLGKPSQPDSSEQALAPINEERPERLVDIDPSTLYTPEQLTPLLVLSDGAVPGTIRGLLTADLQELVAEPSQIARVDLRWSHDPAQWPATVQPPGVAELVRIVEQRECDGQMPCTRILHIRAGTELSTSEATSSDRQLSPLIAWLNGSPGAMAYAREASTAAHAGAADNPWLEMRILLRDDSTRALVPRRELDAPRDAVAAGTLSAPEGQTPQAPVADDSTRPQWVEEDAEGHLLMQSIDPNATLLTLTFSFPATETAARALLPLAEWLNSAYQLGTASAASGA